MRALATLKVLALVLLPVHALADMPQQTGITLDAAYGVWRPGKEVQTAALSGYRSFLRDERASMGLRAGVWGSTGRTTENKDPPRHWDPAEAVGFFFGPYVRMEQTRQHRPWLFAELGAAVLLTSRDLPNRPGTETNNDYNRFEARVGVAVPRRNGQAWEASLYWTHISNDHDLPENNLNFDGVGLSIGFRFQ